MPTFPLIKIFPHILFCLVKSMCSFRWLAIFLTKHTWLANHSQRAGPGRAERDWSMLDRAAELSRAGPGQAQLSRSDPVQSDLNWSELWLDTWYFPDLNQSGVYLASPYTHISGVYLVSPPQQPSFHRQLLLSRVKGGTSGQSITWSWGCRSNAEIKEHGGDSSDYFWPVSVLARNLNVPGQLDSCHAWQLGMLNELKPEI